jgi:hypothetical protein
LAGHIRVLAAVIFTINRKPIRAMDRASKRECVNVLFRPFGKIRLIWGYFRSEPDTGFFLGEGWVIGGRIEPGLGWVGITPTHVPGLMGVPPPRQTRTKPVIFRNSTLVIQSFFEKTGNSGELFWKSPETLPDFFVKVG